MQAKEEVSEAILQASKDCWFKTAKEVSRRAKIFSEMGLHKQVVNRILEPFQLMKTVLTATEFDNFFWLRKHEDAQPEIKKLAEEMLKAQEQSKPILLLPGEWHLPYFGEHGALFGSFSDEELENAKAISASCCAQVSYRLLDDSLEKALNVYKRLVESEPVHASPFEHQATPMEIAESDYWTDAIAVAFGENGITHMDRAYNMWSGNFKSWIQYRQLIEGNVCNKYEEK